MKNIYNEKYKKIKMSMKSVLGIEIKIVPRTVL